MFDLIIKGYFKFSFDEEKHEFKICDHIHSYLKRVPFEGPPTRITTFTPPSGNEIKTEIFK